MVISILLGSVRIKITVNSGNSWKLRLY